MIISLRNSRFRFLLATLEFQARKTRAREQKNWLKENGNDSYVGVAVIFFSAGEALETHKGDQQIGAEGRGREENEIVY